MVTCSKTEKYPVVLLRWWRTLLTHVCTQSNRETPQVQDGEVSISAYMLTGWLVRYTSLIPWVPPRPPNYRWLLKPACLHLQINHVHSSSFTNSSSTDKREQPKSYVHTAQTELLYQVCEKMKWLFKLCCNSNTFSTKICSEHQRWQKLYQGLVWAWA